MNTTATTPLVQRILTLLSCLYETPTAALGPTLRLLNLVKQEPELVQAYLDFLTDRALRLLRGGSKTELQEEALLLARAISGNKGKGLRAADLRVFGWLEALQQLLSEAGRRRDSLAIPSLLKGNQGEALLQALKDGPLSADQLSLRVPLQDGGLAELLLDLNEADLIVAYSREGQVWFELGAAGEAYVKD